MSSRATLAASTLADILASSILVPLAAMDLSPGDFALALVDLTVSVVLLLATSLA
jgi:hypothetical protein